MEVKFEVYRPVRTDFSTAVFVLHLLTEFVLARDCVKRQARHCFLRHY